MKRTKLLVLAAASIAVMSAAASTMAATPLPLGWYLEANAGSSRITNENYGTNISNSSSAFGWNLNGGYKFMPYFAGEIGYTHYGTIKIKSGGVQAGQAKNYSYYLAGKGILPISDSGFEAFAKLGIVRINNKLSITNSGVLSSNNASINSGTKNTTGVYLGVGGDYYFTNNVAVNAQWARAKGNSRSGNLDLYSLGISYLFG